MTFAMPESTLQAFLENALTQTPQVRRLVVGFSGGLDSTVLLHLLHRQAEQHGCELRAVHVHHGLSPNADAWAAHARGVCLSWQIPLQIHHIQVASGASLEASARTARRQAYADSLAEADALLLAQHEDDQAETLLFRLLRGAGVTGLGAMRAISGFALSGKLTVPLWRPLLDVSRAVLLQYARQHELVWVEDESNQDVRYSRNFLRNEIIPRLRQHWPAASSTLAATALRLQEADALLQEMATEMASACIDSAGRLLISCVLDLPPARQRLLMRYWLHLQSFRLPDEAILERIRLEVMMAREDAMPRVAWEGCEIRRYRQHVYALLPLPELPVDWRSSWDLTSPLMLPDGRVLSAEVPSGFALPDCHVRFRRGGETLRGHGLTQEVKKLLQASAIPPWERERLPMVFAGNELMAVAGTTLRSTLLPSAVHFSLAPGCGHSAQ